MEAAKAFTATTKLEVEMKLATIATLILAMTLSSVDPSSASDGAPAPASAKPDKEHLRTALKLLETMETDKALQKGIENMVDLKIKQQPLLAPYRETLLKFFSKYTSWDSLKNDMAAIYAENFTTEELKKLIDFYQTPVGKKFARKNPELARRGSILGMQKVQEHMLELREMIQKASQKLSK